MNTLFRIILTFNATSLLLIVFLVQHSFTLEYFFPTCSYFANLNNYFSYAIYILIPILLTLTSIIASRLLSEEKFKRGQIVKIEHANNSFLPSYLGYFFVALSISNWETLTTVYSILFCFTFLSQALYFNPLFLLFGFTFYNITTKNGSVIFLISRNDYKTPLEVEITKSSRINNYTFIER